jgi:hypothetical protein
MDIHLWTNENAPFDSYTVEFQLYNQRGDLISLGAANPISNVFFNASDRHFICRLGPLPLTTGSYAFTFTVRQWGLELWDRWDHAIDFHIVRCDPYKTGTDLISGGFGDFILQQHWTVGPNE